ncbi:MAG: YqcI/YcgG family protein [Patescibacteria group bacterium]
MHNSNAQHFDWSPEVSNDIEDPSFSYSTAAKTFFVPFMNAYSGTPARYSEIPMVVFNSNMVFQLLRDQVDKNGITAFDKLKQKIRAREGWVHPALGDHGEQSEFDQYALVDPTPEMESKEEEIKKEILGECPFGH